MLHPVFIDGHQGELHINCFLPKPGFPSHALLLIPPFTEEMNKSRRMLAQLGHQLAQQGGCAILPDLHGTGDSDGLFEEARWEIWIDDLIRTVTWLKQKGVRYFSLLGLRLGGLLAAELASRLDPIPDKLLLWQPALTGKSMLTQFLRLRIAAQMDSGIEKETTSMLREKLKNGNYLEISGYTLSPDLALTLDGLALENYTIPADTTIHWFNINLNPEKPLGKASQNIANQWETNGSPVTVHSVHGDSFWSTQEITDAPELLKITLDQYLGTQS